MEGRSLGCVQCGVQITDRPSLSCLFWPSKYPSLRRRHVSVSWSLRARQHFEHYHASCLSLCDTDMKAVKMEIANCRSPRSREKAQQSNETKSWRQPGPRYRNPCERLQNFPLLTASSIIVAGNESWSVIPIMGYTCRSLSRRPRVGSLQ